MKVFTYGLGALLGASLLASFSASAAPFPLTANVDIIVDENGNGVLVNMDRFYSTLDSVTQSDVVGPGGLNSVLTFSLLSPPGLTAGDVLLQEPGGRVSDVLRFNPTELCRD